MGGHAALFFLAEVSLSRVPIVLLSIHIVSCIYFRTYTRLVQYLFFKQPLETEKNILERMEQKNEKEQIAASSVIHQPQSNIVMTEEGWVCPVCGWNNDPSDTICFNCNRK